MEEEGIFEDTQEQTAPIFKPLCESYYEEGAKAPNPKYEDGKVLLKRIRSRFLQSAKPYIPLQEIDPYFYNKQSFIVIGRWGTIHRFSCKPDSFFILDPNNIFRRLAIYLQTNWIFSILLVTILLLNIVALTTTQNFEIMRQIDHMHEKSWLVDVMYIVDYICLTVYCFELFVKIIARGLLGDEFTCLKDPWTWLDLLVISSGFIPSFPLRRALVWSRIFKIVPLVPSIRQACGLSLRAVNKLVGMIMILILLLWIFAMVGSHLYMGTLRQKCVKQLSEQKISAIADEMSANYIQNMSNWHQGEYGFALCGNAIGARKCPEGYVCLHGIGENPDFGYTNFDNIFWSLLSVIRIASEDFTEEIFKQVVGTNGPSHIVFFVAIFFLITFPMGCLFFAILGSVFTESKTTSELEQEEYTSRLDDVQDSRQNRGAFIEEPSVAQEEELVGFRKSLHSVIYHNWMRITLICVILTDIFSIASDYYGIEAEPFDYHLYIRVIPIAVFFLYTIEFVLKIIALGPVKYFCNTSNLLDLIVLLTFFVEINSYFGHYNGYKFAPIRLLKLVQYWPSLQMIFVIYYKAIKALWGWILYALIVFGFFVFIGPFVIGQYELEGYKAKGELSVNDIPRFSFIDFWHSFRVIVRMQIAEWIETLWLALPYAGWNAFIYYLVAYLCGALLISFLLIGVVHTTVEELQNDYHPLKERGLRLFLRRTIGLVYSPILRAQTAGADTLPVAENGAEGNVVGSREREYSTTETSGHLRKVIQDCMEHWAYKITCSGLIIIASLAMVFETKENGNDIQTALFVIEILFTVVFFIISVYELLSFGIKESILNRGWLFDTLIVLENILNLSIYHFLVTGSFRIGVLCIRSFRPLMLISRVDWLKATFRGLKYELKIIWETVVAIFFIWLLFDTFGVHFLAGHYRWCVNPESGDEVALPRIECLANNYTWRYSDFHFDNSADGFLNMVFLVSRMGWVAIINHGSDAIAAGEARQKDITKFWLLYFIIFVLIGGLGALGILFSYIHNKFQEDKGYNIILTENQVSTYNEIKTRKKSQPTWMPLEDEYIPAPEPPCLLSLYNFVTNRKFDAAVMILIVLDNVCMSFEHHMQSHGSHVVISLLQLAILFLFVIEMIVKLIAWRIHYFWNGWNILDFIVVITGILELFMMEFADYFVTLIPIRKLRLLRIFRFLLAKTCGSQTAKSFLSAISNVRHVFGNLILFQLTSMWAFALLGMYLFGNVKQTGALDQDVNFQTFRSSFWTLALLLGFPCLDGLYLGLSNQEDCSINNSGTGACGGKTAAIIYIGLYASITFFVLLNMYAVLITEIMSEIERIKKNGMTEGDVPLHDVKTRNETQEPSSSGADTGSEEAE